MSKSTSSSLRKTDIKNIKMTENNPTMISLAFLLFYHFNTSLTFVHEFQFELFELKIT